MRIKRIYQAFLRFVKFGARFKLGETTVIVVSALPIVVIAWKRKSTAAKYVHFCLGMLKASYANIEKLLNSSTVMLYLDAMESYRDSKSWYFASMVSSSDCSTSTNSQGTTEAKTAKPSVRRSAFLNNGSISHSSHLHSWTKLSSHILVIGAIVLSPLSKEYQSLFNKGDCWVNILLQRIKPMGEMTFPCQPTSSYIIKDKLRVK